MESRYCVFLLIVLQMLQQKKIVQKHPKRFVIPPSQIRERNIDERPEKMFIIV